MVALIGMCLGVAFPTMASLEECRFKWIREQEYDNSCGVSAVASLATLYWGLTISEGELIAMVDSSARKEQREISLYDLTELLGSLEFFAQGFSVSYEALLQASMRYGPVIVHLNEGQGHFVLLIGENAGQPIVGDPSDGMAIWPARSFARSWSGVALVVSHTIEMLDRRVVAAAIHDLQRRQVVLLDWGVR